MPISDETLYLTLSQAGRLMPGTPSPTAMWRRCRHGLKDAEGNQHRLRHVRLGNRIFTTRTWVEDFMAVFIVEDQPDAAPVQA